MREFTRLREQIEDEVPQKLANAALVLCTWNIRNFDDDRFIKVARTNEDLYYLAQIISHFEAMAIQDIFAQEGLMRFLRNDYRYHH